MVSALCLPLGKQGTPPFSSSPPPPHFAPSNVADRLVLAPFAFLELLHELVEDVCHLIAGSFAWFGLGFVVVASFADQEESEGKKQVYV